MYFVWGGVARTPKIQTEIGLFQKISTTPQWTILNWVLKNFRISKNDSSSFCRISNLADSKSWGTPEFCNTSNDFRGIPVKIHKIWRKFMDFQSCSLSIFTGFPMSSMGGVWIFSGIAHCLVPNWNLTHYLCTFVNYQKTVKLFQSGWPKSIKHGNVWRYSLAKKLNTKSDFYRIPIVNWKVHNA